MPDKSDLIGKGGRPPGVSTGLSKASGGRGGVGTNWKDIKWTKNKLVGATIALGLPYLLCVIMTWTMGMPVISYILIGVAMLVGFVFLVVGWIDSDEF
ncbi:MAG: hypothetical protein AAGA80_00520 [Cyanobacteria bacterium P01_F01_bin.143]